MKQLNYAITLLWLVAAILPAAAQPTTLKGLIDEALRNNNMLRASSYKVDEEASKITEIAIKRYPALTANAAYMYRFKLGALSFPTGSFGTLPLGEGELGIPPYPINMDFGRHNTVIAGATLYQPLLQLPKIGSGIVLAKSNLTTAELELTKAELAVVNGVEKLYYGLLSVGSRKEEAKKLIAAAERRLYDAESALLAGKALEANLAGLNADLADKRQDLIRYANEEADYLSDLRKLTGMELADPSAIIADSATAAPTDCLESLDYYMSLANVNNVDVRLSHESVGKSQIALRAAKQSYLPDLGIMAGYTYQDFISLLPRNNTYVGISLSWNIQDVWANRQQVRQKKAMNMQAIENEQYVHRSVQSAVEKAYRHAEDALGLLAVARKALDYNDEMARISRDRHDAGLCTSLDVLTAEAALAKSQADYYSAKQAYRIALADLRQLTARR